jgi:hypothetical protein
MKTKNNKFDHEIWSSNPKYSEPAIDVSVNIIYSKKDWEQLSEDAEKLGYTAQKLLGKRLKKTIHTRNPTSRLENEQDIKRFTHDYAQLWLPFVKYLIYTHLTVLVGGLFVEVVLGGGKSYILIYWVYLLSLCSAILSFMGLKLKLKLEIKEQDILTDWLIRLEVWLARVSMYLAIFSVMIFFISVSLRAILGINSFFHVY